jgi:hypothetical protein
MRGPCAASSRAMIKQRAYAHRPRKTDQGKIPFSARRAVAPPALHHFAELAPPHHINSVAYGQQKSTGGIEGMKHPWPRPHPLDQHRLTVSQSLRDVTGLAIIDMRSGRASCWLGRMGLTWLGEIFRLVHAWSLCVLASFCTHAWMPSTRANISDASGTCMQRTCFRALTLTRHTCCHTDGWCNVFSPMAGK